MIQRSAKLSNSHSFFLFGARGTGKSYLLKEYFRNIRHFYLDLLSPEISDQLIAYPSKFLDLISPHKNKLAWIIVDEVQKAPKSLDLVHQQIHENNFLFALTGSSARKLKRGSANLLAGRAYVFNLFPFTHTELLEKFDLEQTIQFGSLPEVINSENQDDKKRYLKAYANTYLKEEILIEQIIRNLPPFKRFLEVAALGVGEPLSYSNIAKDILSDPKTVSNYFEILEDTLIGLRLDSFHLSLRKQQKKAPKFYLFDNGVLRTLAGRVDYDLIPKSFEYGQLFENFIVNEVHRILTYSEKQFKLSYLRVNDNQEIDLIIERAGLPTFYCEIKSTEKADPRHSNSLETLTKGITNSVRLLISRDKQEQLFGTTHALYWKEALAAILAGSV